MEKIGFKSEMKKRWSATDDDRGEDDDGRRDTVNDCCEKSGEWCWHSENAVLICVDLYATFDMNSSLFLF